MAVAIDAGDTEAMVLGVVAMVAIIMLMDFVIWRPVLSWVHRYRLEEVLGNKPSEPLIQLVLRESYTFEWLRKLSRAIRAFAKKQIHHHVSRKHRKFSVDSLGIHLHPMREEITGPNRLMRLARVVAGVGGLGCAVFLVSKVGNVVRYFAEIPGTVWVDVLRSTFWTFLRVVATLILSSIWAVPVGIWIGMSARRVRAFQPLIQVLASFPAPMLYPLALTLFFKLGIGFNVGSMFLMLLGVQWYVLFNVLAGAMRIPSELQFATQLMDTRASVRWMKLYLPSVFPALVTGWVTAAGGAWNASIVAEYLSYHGKTLTTDGLGAAISAAAAKPDFQLLAASLTVMVVTVVLLNRVVWARVYEVAQTRFRMDI